MTEDGINKPDERSIEYIQSEQGEGKTDLKKINKTSGTCGIITKDPTFVQLEFQKRRN